MNKNNKIHWQTRKKTQNDCKNEYGRQLKIQNSEISNLCVNLRFIEQRKMRQKKTIKR